MFVNSGKNIIFLLLILNILLISISSVFAVNVTVHVECGAGECSDSSYYSDTKDLNLVFEIDNPGNNQYILSLVV